MPEAYTHIRIARAALAQSGEHAPSMAAYEMGANGPDPLFAYRVLSAKRPWPLPELGGRMHDEQCGRFLRTMIFAASTPAQRSYALGFLAHYAADSVMHPYVAFQCGPQGQFNIPEGTASARWPWTVCSMSRTAAHPPFRRELPLRGCRLRSWPK